MIIGAIILARLSSSRLPFKGLRCISGKEVLKHISDGLSSCEYINKIIIATSIEPEDDEIETFCARNDISCYRGSLSNVAGRFLAAARSNELTHAIRINGDNLF